MIGWTIAALEHVYNSCAEGRAVSNVYSGTALLSQTSIIVLFNLLVVLSQQDHVCLRLLARCLTLITIEKLESIVHDTQVSVRIFA